MSDEITELSKKIIKRLPYSDDFLFADRIIHVDNESIIGNYTFKSNAFFYKSHFKHRPETPGVILLEMMGQLGMVSHLIYLEKLYTNDIVFSPLFANVEAGFLKKVYPEEILTVYSQKIYYRNGVLKSSIKLVNPNQETCILFNAQLKLVYE